MNFGQNYFDVLTSRIGGASNIWNRQGMSHLSRSRTTGTHGVSRSSAISAGSKYFGLSVNTIKAINSVYNTAYSNSVLSGYNTKTGELSVDKNALRNVKRDDVKKILGSAGAVGQRLKNNAALTSQAAIVSSRYSLNTSVYGANGRYGFGSFLGGLWL